MTGFTLRKPALAIEMGVKVIPWAGGRYMAVVDMTLGHCPPSTVTAWKYLSILLWHAFDGHSAYSWLDDLQTGTKFRSRL